MALPAARLTRKQIRDLACRRAGNAALSDTDAVQYLQLILDGLYEQYEWPFLFTSVAITILASTFPLPSDFLKAQDDTAFQMNTFDGQPVVGVIWERDRDTFTQESALNAITPVGQPNIWTADRNLGIGLVSPDPTGHNVGAVLRYKFLPASQVNADGSATLAESTDVPVFPYHRFLVQQLYADVLAYEGDPRAETADAAATAMLQAVLGTANPLRSSRGDVPLDPELFRTPFRED